MHGKILSGGQGTAIGLIVSNSQINGHTTCSGGAHSYMLPGMETTAKAKLLRTLNASYGMSYLLIALIC